MRYPRLRVQETKRQIVEYFRGYNHNLKIWDGEFYDMENLTSDYYPVLSPRKPRGVYARPGSPQGLIAKEKLCYVDGTAFVIGQDRHEMGLSVLESDCPKSLVSMGAYVVIMPDKKYINTISPEDRGSIEASFESTGTVTFTQGSLSGAELEESTYIKIQAEGIGQDFQVYDGVRISGVKNESLKDLNGTLAVWDKGEDWLLVVGVIDQDITQTEPITVERRMPNMDFMTESDNRLWGCRYGLNDKGEQVNEIYACRQGDFRNWESFIGTAKDSYMASCGTDGPFTGAVTLLGSPLFFKETCVHKVYGDYPATYRIQDTACRGVERGSHGSMAIVGETLFYKARSGVCAFDGSLPVEVSPQLGNVKYSQAVGGALGSKYYISMISDRGAWNLFVYDTAKGLWHREDNLRASFLCGHKGEMYCVDAENRNIITLLGSGEPGEEAVHWMAQTGDIGVSSPEQKYLQNISIRLMMEAGSKVDIYAQYDHQEEWVEVCTIFGTSLRSFDVPIRPRRCDHMRLRMEGTGQCRIYAITKVIEKGSWRS